MKGHVLTLESLRLRLLYTFLGSLFFIGGLWLLFKLCDTKEETTSLATVGFIVITIILLTDIVFSLGAIIIAWSEDFDKIDKKKKHDSMQTMSRNQRSFLFMWLLS